MADRKVKGSMLLDQVRMIRANKDKDWDKYLKPEDWEIINGRILPSMWYPLEIFQRCGLGVFNLVAGGNLDIVRARGRARGKELFGEIYKSLVADPDPLKALDRFVLIQGQIFSWSTLEFEKIDDKHAKMSSSYDSDDPSNKPYCYQLMGYLDQLVEMAGGKNARIELTAKQWEGDPATIFDITWE